MYTTLKFSHFKWKAKLIQILFSKKCKKQLFCKKLVIKKFKSELKPNGIELSVDGADESADIEDMCTYAIT